MPIGQLIAILSLIKAVPGSIKAISSIYKEVDEYLIGDNEKDIKFIKQWMELKEKLREKAK